MRIYYLPAIQLFLIHIFNFTVLVAVVLKAFCCNVLRKSILQKFRKNLIYPFNFILCNFIALFHKRGAQPRLSISLTDITVSYFISPFLIPYHGVASLDVCQYFPEYAMVILSCFCSNKRTKMKDIYKNHLSSS